MCAIAIAWSAHWASVQANEWARASCTRTWTYLHFSLIRQVRHDISVDSILHGSSFWAVHNILFKYLATIKVKKMNHKKRYNSTYRTQPAALVVNAIDYIQTWACHTVQSFLSYNSKPTYVWVKQNMNGKEKCKINYEICDTIGKSAIEGAAFFGIFPKRIRTYGSTVCAYSFYPF